MVRLKIRVSHTIMTCEAIKNDEKWLHKNTMHDMLEKLMARSGHPVVDREVDNGL